MLDRHFPIAGLIWLKDVPAVGGYTASLEGPHALVGALVPDGFALTADTAMHWPAITEVTRLVLCWRQPTTLHGPEIVRPIFAARCPAATARGEQAIAAIAEHRLSEARVAATAALMSRGERAPVQTRVDGRQIGDK
jgi:hypothetical protein